MCSAICLMRYQLKLYEEKARLKLLEEEEDKETKGMISRHKREFKPGQKVSSGGQETF